MTAQPGRQPIYIYRGDPWAMSLSSTLDGQDETVVAAAARAQIRATTETPAVLAEMAVAVTEGTRVHLSLSPAQTSALDPGKYVWDFQPAPDAETWLRGPVVVEGDVSR